MVERPNSLVFFYSLIRGQEEIPHIYLDIN
jgi:hypothetical protein